MRTGKDRTSGNALQKASAKAGIVRKFLGKKERSVMSSKSRELFVFSESHYTVLADLELAL